MSWVPFSILILLYNFRFRCTVIFVPDLECDFVAFDGFLLLSSAWLHDESAIFMEMPTHLLLLRYSRYFISSKMLK